MKSPTTLFECNALPCALCICVNNLQHGNTLEESCNTKRKLKHKETYDGLKDIRRLFLK